MAVYQKSRIIHIDWLGNDNFCIFNENDAKFLLYEHRIVAEKIISATTVPYILMPEQVQSEEYIVKLAHIIVTGRKNKRLNAHTNLDDGSPSNKKAREDFPEIENSPSDEQGQQDEVEQAIKEIRTKLDDEKNVTVVKFAPNSKSYGCIQNLTFPNSQKYYVKLTTFRDLWRKGFYLTSGVKFGCDFLAYEKMPDTVHSRFMVISLSSNDSLNPLDMVALGRVASHAKKDILFSIVSPGSLLPQYLQLNWWRGN